MANLQNPASTSATGRIDVSHEYAVCAWARHFNVSEQRVKEAVAAVGDQAEMVRAHLHRASSAEIRLSN